MRVSRIGRGAAALVAAGTVSALVGACGGAGELLGGGPACAVDLETSAATPAQFVELAEREAPAIADECGIPGAYVAVMVDGEVAYELTHGAADHDGTVPVTADTVFRAASVSKTFTAWVTVLLADQGVVDLDAEVMEYLDEWPLETSYPDGGITLRHLLTHTAGLSLGGYEGWTDPDDVPDLGASLRGDTNGDGAVESVDPPGERYRYSSGGITLLQLVLEEVTGEPMEALGRELLLDPLGLTATSYDLPEDWPAALGPVDGDPVVAEGHDDDNDPAPPRFAVEVAQGGIWTTGEDLVAFARAHFPGGGLDEDLLDTMTVPTEQSLEESDGARGYGLGYQVTVEDQVTVVGHDGSTQAGFKARVFVAPELGTGIVVLANSRTGDGYDALVDAWRASLGRSAGVE